MARSIGVGWRKGSASEAATTVDAGDVAQMAYELFERRGRVHGHDLEDWLEAERIVRQRRRNGGRR